MAPSNEFAKSAWMLASIAVVVAALYLARDILVPVTLAVLLSFLLSPVCDWLERRRLGRTPAVLVTATLAFAGLGLVAWTAVNQVSDLAPKMPKYQENLQAKLHSTSEYVSAALNKVSTAVEGFGQQPTRGEPPQGTPEEPFAVRVLLSPTSPLEVLGGTLGPLLKVLGTGGIVLILVVFFLIRRDDLRDRFIRLVGQGHVTVTTQMLEDAATRVSRYLVAQLFINATFGVVVAIGLALIGVPNAVLWGILATTLRFIPYIGPWLAAAMPIGLSLAISTGWLEPVLTLGLFVVLELFTNNVMEPWLYGKHTGVSPVAVLVAALFWAWLWGIIGLLLATPLTVCLLVIGKHVPQLSFLDILLGNEAVFELSKRLYQRLLAGDQEEAAELLEDCFETQSLIEVYDTVVMPALVSTQIHGHRGELDENRHEFILQSLKEIIQDRADSRPAPPARKEAVGPAEETHADVADADFGSSMVAPRSFILTLPARHEADEIAGLMLTQLIDLPGCVVRSVTVPPVDSDLAEIIGQQEPDVICISAMTPAAVLHARSIYKRVSRRFPNAKVVIGLWNAQGDLAKAKDRIGCGETTRVVRTLADAREQIHLLIEPLLPYTATNRVMPASSLTLEESCL